MYVIARVYEDTSADAYVVDCFYVTAEDFQQSLGSCHTAKYILRGRNLFDIVAQPLMERRRCKKGKNIVMPLTVGVVFRADSMYHYPTIAIAGVCGI